MPVQPFLAELAAVSRAWPVARNSALPQAGALCVLLRGIRKSAIGDRARCDVHESRWTSASYTFRHTSNFLRRFADERGVELGRAKLVRFPAGHRVHAHVEHGEYHLFRDRYHLILQSASGFWLGADDEHVTMREGELWKFNNKAVHDIRNAGAGDSLHLVFDVLNADGKRLLAHAARTRARREGISIQPEI